MNSFNVILLFALFSVCAGGRPRLVNDKINDTHPNQEETWMTAKNVYAFTVKDMEGNDVPLSNYRGKLLIIVNVASKCGLTKVSYRKLMKLHTKYFRKGLVILGFPCNQFRNQEPDTNEEIAAYVKKLGVTFQIFSKIDVNGENASPLWKYLKLKIKNNENISMSFTKFIVNRVGEVVQWVSPITDLKTEQVVRNFFGSYVLR